MSELLSYMAGYFDGEGCVSVTHIRRKYPSLKITVASGDKEAVDLFIETFSGCSHKEKMGPENKRQIYRWYVHGKRAQEVLSALLPYLRAKRVVAELALQMNLDTTRRSISEEDIRLRNEIGRQIRAFNQRVTVGLPD